MYIIIGLIVFIGCVILCHNIANSRGATPVFWGLWESCLAHWQFRLYLRQSLPAVNDAKDNGLHRL